VAHILTAFLSPEEIAALRDHAAAAEGWTPGRQNTGYDILPLKKAQSAAPGSLETPKKALPAGLVNLGARCLAHLGPPVADYWDVYLIRYHDGTYIPEHVDDAQLGMRHQRINAVVTAATAGGELRIDGTLVELSVGEAVRFFPDREVHAVTTVTGTRLLFSVGAWITDDDAGRHTL
jgi:predicted 2-oxoglutarate/Fe(II)-dependent dioxygenase YbiX